jgi:uncharacterized protein YjdB
MAVDGADVALAVDETSTLSVIGIYQDNGSSMTGKLSNDTLTFTSGNDEIATVTSGGVVTGISAGTTTIDINVTSKPEVKCYAEVTVTSA